MPRKPRCPNCGSGKFNKIDREWICNTCGHIGSKKIKDGKSRRGRKTW